MCFSTDFDCQKRAMSILTIFQRVHDGSRQEVVFWNGSRCGGLFFSVGIVYTVVGGVFVDMMMSPIPCTKNE